MLFKERLPVCPRAFTAEVRQSAARRRRPVFRQPFVEFHGRQEPKGVLSIVMQRFRAVKIHAVRPHELVIPVGRIPVKPFPRFFRQFVQFAHRKVPPRPLFMHGLGEPTAKRQIEKILREAL